MRAPPALLFLAACTRGVAAWAPLDVVAGLFGTKPLNSGQATRPYPIDDVEHVACSMGLGGCVPTKGCRVHMGRCEPRVGHYWPIPNAPPPPQLWFDRLLPAIAPAFHMMTERGVLEATPGFWFAGYRLLDDPHGDTSSTVAGIERAKLVAYWFAIPGMLIFLAYIGVRGS